jgi:hypothetical protein
LEILQTPAAAALSDFLSRLPACRRNTLSLDMGESIGTQPDGSFVTNYVAQPGRVIVVGEQPLLEAVLGANGQPSLTLYALPGTTNVLETTASLADPASWSANRTVVMTNLFQIIEPVCTNRCTLFFRAKRN